MADPTKVNLSINATGEQETKNAFDTASKVMGDFWRGAAEGWKKELEAVKVSHAETDKLAKKVSGGGKDDVVGAFSFADAALRTVEFGFRRALPVTALAEAAAYAVNTYASLEQAEKKVVATGKESLDSTKKLERQWKDTLGNVQKPIEKLLDDYAQTLIHAEKLKEYFPLMQMAAMQTGASYESVMRLAQQGFISGVLMSEMPAYLNRMAQALLLQNEAGVQAATRVTQNLRERGMKGKEWQQETLVIVGQLAGPLGSAANAAQVYNATMNKAMLKIGEGRMYDKADDLIEGRMRQFEFIDEMMQRTDPEGEQWQERMRRDPETAALVKAWPFVRQKIFAILSQPAPDLTKSPMAEPGTAEAIFNFAESLRELFAAIGEGKTAVAILNYAAKLIGFFSFVERGHSADELGKRHEMPIVIPHPSHREPAGPPAPSRGTSGSGVPSVPLPPRFADGGTADRQMEAMTGERGSEAILGADGSSRVVDKATISSLNAGDNVVPLTGSGPDRRVNPKNLYDNLFAKFSKSALAGQVPPGGGKYGITTGSPEEYATLGVANAMTEGGMKAGTAPDPGDASRGLESIGLYQFDQGQAHKWGGGDAYNPEASASAFVNYAENRALGPGTTWKGGSGKGIDAMGDTFSSFRKGGGATMQNIGYARRIAGAGHGINTAGGSLDESSGEAPTGGYDVADRYRPQRTEQAFRPTVKPKIEPIAPERHEVERTARNVVSRGRDYTRRQAQSSGHGKIGFQ